MIREMDHPMGPDFYTGRPGIVDSATPLRDLETLAQRVERQMQIRGVSAGDLYKRTGVSAVTITRLLHEGSDIRVTDAAKLVDNLSTRRSEASDLILGPDRKMYARKSPGDEEDAVALQRIPEFGGRFQWVKDRTTLSSEALADVSDVSPETIDNYTNGITTPSLRFVMDASALLELSRTVVTVLVLGPYYKYLMPDHTPGKLPLKLHGPIARVQPTPQLKTVITRKG